jgi:hypothetical protein
MSDETTNPTTPEQTETPEQAAPEAPAAAPQAAAPAIYKVMVFDLHSGSLTEIPCASMGTAIDTYKRVNATARFERPFTVFDDLKWVAQHNYAGGKVRVVPRRGRPEPPGPPRRGAEPAGSSSGSDHSGRRPRPDLGQIGTKGGPQGLPFCHCSEHNSSTSDPKGVSQ